jgi:heme oxygenase
MPDLNPSTTRAFDEIDAAVFSGDAFLSRENAAHLRKYLDRWDRALASIEEDFADEDSADRDAAQSAGTHTVDEVD